jgi:autophagy-related protein 33
MEASYEVLGESHSEESAPSPSMEEFDDDINGEEVRSEVEFFVRNQLVQTTVAGVGLVMAVLGIWGDGAHQVADTLVIEL